MYTLISQTPAGQLLKFRLPALAASLLVAEAFYKFHSFILEAGAFLVTWYAVDFVSAALERRLAQRG